MCNKLLILEIVLMPRTRQLTRHGFLKVAAPHIVPASVPGLAKHPAPSERILVGCVGLGGRGDCDMVGLMNDPRVQVVAICDCDRGSRNYERGWHRDLAPVRAKIEVNYRRKRLLGCYWRS
jgi:hypothetical protein